VAEGGEAPAEAKEAAGPAPEARPAQRSPDVASPEQAQSPTPERSAKKAPGTSKKTATATSGEAATSKKRSGAKNEGPKRAPEPAAPAPAEGRKRELPPYLRVVK
jgi:hypothetical protein